MEIEFHCEKCGHTIRVPRESAGQQSKCPHCENDIYIPTPEEDLEELPLAPEDNSIAETERQLQEERRRLDHALAHESAGLDDSAASGTSGPAGKSRMTVKEVVLAYLSAMRDSDLSRAKQAASLLARNKQAALGYLEQLAADQIPPAEMTNVPPAVYQGFLKSLRAKLS